MHKPVCVHTSSESVIVGEKYSAATVVQIGIEYTTKHQTLFGRGSRVVGMHRTVVWTTAVMLYHNRILLLRDPVAKILQNPV